MATNTPSTPHVPPNPDTIWVSDVPSAFDASPAAKAP